MKEGLTLNDLFLKNRLPVVESRHAEDLSRSRLESETRPAPSVGLADCCWLKGAHGDAYNAVFYATCYNLRWLMPGARF
ncbi:hypothetical protein NRY95_12590 [Xanthomonas campestris pv. phormiicola]|nr:hypothetical protein [Xanthomonas campestris pv. phormiicola]UYC14585.1 hypothetical protein NRY95_12590 [Xanthomonas campestris pv. phormiicola]